MKVLLFGASGLIGRGVLRQCLLDDAVTQVTAVVRQPLPADAHVPSAKLQQCVAANMFDYTDLQAQLSGFDACFICLGVAAKDMLDEAVYTRNTFDLAMAAAQAVAALNPQVVLAYVSGAGSGGDSGASNNSKVMWVRVKGRLEAALLALPVRHVTMLRPVAVLPMHGEQPKNGLYRLGYTLGKPFFGLLRKLMPKHIVTTENMGRAMLAVAKQAHSAQDAPRILESADIARY